MAMEGIYGHQDTSYKATLFRYFSRWGIGGKAVLGVRHIPDEGTDVAINRQSAGVDQAGRGAYVERN